MIPASFAEKSMSSLLRLHGELSEEKERRIDLYRRLMEREQAFAELAGYVRLLESELSRLGLEPVAPLAPLAPPAAATSTPLRAAQRSAVASSALRPSPGPSVAQDRPPGEPPAREPPARAAPAPAASPTRPRPAAGASPGARGRTALAEGWRSW